MSAPETPICFGQHPVLGEGFVVSLQGANLLEPVVACAEHVGDLLGNVAKSTLRSSAVRAMIKVERLKP